MSPCRRRAERLRGPGNPRIYDSREIHRLLGQTAALRHCDRVSGAILLKPFPYSQALRLMQPSLDAFAVSSLVEANDLRERPLDRRLASSSAAKGIFYCPSRSSAFHLLY